MLRGCFETLVFLSADKDSGASGFSSLSLFIFDIEFFFFFFLSPFVCGIDFL